MNRIAMLVASLVLVLLMVPTAAAEAREPGCKTRACDARVKKKVGCKTNSCHTRVKHKRWKKIIAPHQSWLRKVRYCESGNHGLYRTNTGNGFYGAYQFTLSSWRAVGGYGFPHNARPIEQDYRAVLLLRLQGRGAWPHCGR